MSSIILSIEQVGQELGGLSPLDVQRQIALRNLSATPLANGGWGVTPGQLHAFAEKGVTDLRAPDFEDREMSRLFDRFRDAIAAAAAEQVPTDEALGRKFNELVNGREPLQSFDHMGHTIVIPGVDAKMTRPEATRHFAQDSKIILTPKVRKVIDSPPKLQYHIVGDRTYPDLTQRFGNWGTVAIAHLLRQAVVDQVDRNIAAFYHSPEDYAVQAATAMKAVRGQNVVAMRRKVGDWRGQNVWWVLKGAELIDALPGRPSDQKLIQLAF